MCVRTRVQTCLPSPKDNGIAEILKNCSSQTFQAYFLNYQIPSSFILPAKAFYQILCRGDAPE